MQVQHGGAGFVAIHRLLHLLVHGHRDVFREVFRRPFRAIGGYGDDYLFLVLGVQRIVEELHGRDPLFVLVKSARPGTVGPDQAKRGLRRACRR
ncbi:hypothetical protein D9M70_633460 [compost metagenome]